jgi:hypothetical protein
MVTHNASVNVLSYIPGDSENSTEGGHPLESALCHLVDSGTTYERDYTVAGFDTGLDTVKVTAEPLIDNWLAGDMERSLPTDLDIALQKEADKYEENGGITDQTFRARNGIEVTVEASDGSITDTSKTYHKQSNRSVVEQEDLNTVKDDLDIVYPGGEKPQYTSDKITTIDGVEAYAVSTIYGAYSNAAVDLYNISRSVGGYDFFDTTLEWQFEGIGLSGPVETVLGAADNIVTGPLLDVIGGGTPNIFTFINLYVTAEGAQYVRIWDSSVFPRHAVYWNGIKEEETELSYSDRDKFVWRVLAFFALTTQNVTPYYAPPLQYKAALEAKDFLEDLQDEVENSVTALPGATKSDVADLSNYFPSPGAPVTQFGRNADGSSASESEIDSSLPDSPFYPF